MGLLEPPCGPHRTRGQQPLGPEISSAPEHKWIPGYCPHCEQGIALSTDDVLVCPSCGRAIFVALESSEGERYPEPGAPGTEAEAPPLKVLLASILEDLQEGVIACDGDGEITLFNRAARDFFALPDDPVLPQRWGDHYDVFHGDGVTPIASGAGPLTWALQGAIVKNMEVVVVPKDGRPPRSLLVSGRAINRHSGRLGAVLVMHEISERKQDEAFRLLEAERAVRQRQALEVNDNVVQSLVAARWALAAGDPQRAGPLVEAALNASVEIVQADLDEFKKSGRVKPGDFVRERPAGDAPKES